MSEQKVESSNHLVAWVSKRKDKLVSKDHAFISIVQQKKKAPSPMIGPKMFESWKGHALILAINITTNY